MPWASITDPRASRRTRSTRLTASASSMASPDLPRSVPTCVARMEGPMLGAGRDDARIRSGAGARPVPAPVWGPGPVDGLVHADLGRHRAGDVTELEVQSLRGLAEDREGLVRRHVLAGHEYPLGL